MLLFAIDPGLTCGAVLLDTRLGRIFPKDVRPPRVTEIWPKASINNILSYVRRGTYDEIAIEMIASYGMPVGASTFETCVDIGRVIEAARPRKKPVHRLKRKTDVAMTLCHSMQAKDANIRQAILDIYPATGGGKTPQVGTKARPGPLYGVKNHAWSALAVGLAHLMKGQQS